ncbi:MAG: hypothetical protein JSU61_02155 [Fidelibacterota bacterium]|nr:MAG: hypothetical protein JSU61_02155 [Candidatus Neomarinimicrobiota bacterium]
MSKWKLIILGPAAVGLMGCALQRPPSPLIPQKSIIGITVWTQSKPRRPGIENEYVYFVRMDDISEPFTQESIIKSNYYRDGQAYLVNAEPGHYAAVASRSYSRSTYPLSKYQPGKTNTTLFPKELIKEMDIMVAPGSVVFMGSYIINQSPGLRRADEAQLHYAKLVAPIDQFFARAGALGAYPYKVLTAIFLWQGRCCYKGKSRQVQKTKFAETRFLTVALRHFDGTEWVDVIQERLDELTAAY